MGRSSPLCVAGFRDARSVRRESGPPVVCVTGRGEERCAKGLGDHVLRCKCLGCSAIINILHDKKSGTSPSCHERRVRFMMFHM